MSPTNLFLIFSQGEFVGIGEIRLKSKEILQNPSVIIYRIQ